MPATIPDHLNAVYGPNTANHLQNRIQQLQQSYFGNPSPPPAHRRLPLTERHAILITYGGQISQPGESPLKTLARFAEEYLRPCVSGIHILPFYPSSSDDGFSVIDYFAVDPALGSWEDVRQIGRDFELMFDAVFNHISAQSDWFKNFLQDTPSHREYFITVKGDPDLSQVVRPRALPLLTAFPTAAGERKVWTTFSPDQIDLNAKNPEVLLALVEALLFYVTQGARFIRLDAIAYLWKEIGTRCIHLPQTHRLVQLLRSILDQSAPDVMLITETNVPHADNISYFGDGGNEAQLVYNFALPPLVFHSILSGDATRLSDWAKNLTLPSKRVTFFNFLASHDGIGVNPVRGILDQREIDALVARVQSHGGYVSHKQNPDGSRGPYELNINFFDALSNPNDPTEPVSTQVARFLSAQAIMLALIGVPGIYFHSLFGSRNDRAAAESSGIPRRINRQKLTRLALERELAQPGALRARVFAGYKRLLEIRRGHPAFHPAGTQEILSLDPRVFALLRVSPDQHHQVLCLQNISNSSLSLRLPLLQSQTPWLDLFTHRALTPASLLELPPYAIFWATPKP